MNETRSRLFELIDQLRKNERDRDDFVARQYQKARAMLAPSPAERSETGLMPLREAAAMYGVSYGCLYAATVRGALMVQRRGARWYVTREKMDLWKKRHDAWGANGNRKAAA